MVNDWDLGKSAENQFINGKIILWLKLFKTILKRVCLKKQTIQCSLFLWRTKYFVHSCSWKYSNLAWLYVCYVQWLIACMFAGAAREAGDPAPANLDGTLIPTFETPTPTKPPSTCIFISIYLDSDYNLT